MLLSFLSADHCTITVPVSHSNPAMCRSFTDQNACPREALPGAVLRFIEQDPGRRPSR
jgi:hypothetical protein